MACVYVTDSTAVLNLSETENCIPGLQPSSNGDGNLFDIAKAGSLHEFLLQLHQQFGPIASFWIHKLYVVSIGSPQLFEEQSDLFDRPPELFKTLKPLLGEKSIQFANGIAGQARRRHYDTLLNGDAVNELFSKIQKIADETAQKLESKISQQCVSLQQIRTMFSLKALLNVIFGDSMMDDETVFAFKKAYDVAESLLTLNARRTNSELELRLTQPPTDEREAAFQTSSRYIKDTIKELIDDRKANLPKADKKIILDKLISFSDDEERQLDDAVTFTIGGFHNNLLVWALYHIAKNPDVDRKIFEEMKTVLGKNNVDGANITDLVYLRQVLDETLRVSVIAPWGARVQPNETVLGGYTIPGGTPVIQAFGVVFMDEKIWVNQQEFDPNRFSENNSKLRSNLSFCPFGFAGNRKCPAEDYTYAETTVAIVTLLRKFVFHIAEANLSVTSDYGHVTHPKEDILVTVSARVR